MNPTHDVSERVISERDSSLFGSRPHVVIEHMRQRLERRRHGNAHPDGRKLALIIEGGGMRSMCSGAAMTALHQLGFGDVFDEIYATSGGVMNASYFITQQNELALSMYFENCSQLMNRLRFWKMLDVDYILDTVAAREKKLDLHRMSASPTNLIVTACDYRSGELLLIDTKSTRAPVMQCLRAAMAIPVYYNKTVEIDGRACVDGGTVLPFPLLEVFERDCTDVVVLMTRPASFVERQPSWMIRRVFNAVHSSGHLSRAFSQRHKMSQHVRDLALGRAPAPSGVNILAICPEEGSRIEAMTVDPRTIYAAGIETGRKTMQIFGRNPEEFEFAPPRGLHLR
jgi:predicted patatin/cPLA2 family phospholipase